MTLQATDVKISFTDWTSTRYPEVLELRDAILRRPLGLSIKNDDNRRDSTAIIFIAEHNNKIIGCVLVQPLATGEAQLRAMAVYEEWQGKGVGRMLVLAAEAYCWEHGFKRIILHARKVALGFYVGMSYKITSEEFVEVGIPHYMMEKSVSDSTD